MGLGISNPSTKNWRRLTSGSVAAVALGTFSGSATFTARRLLRVKVSYNLTGAGPAGAYSCRMRVNSAAGAIYNFWVSSAAETATLGATSAEVSVSNPTIANNKAMCMVYLQGIQAGNGLGGTIMGSYDNNAGGAVHRNIAISDGGVAIAGITSVQFSMTGNAGPTWGASWTVDYDTDFN